MQGDAQLVVQDAKRSETVSGTTSTVRGRGLYGRARAGLAMSQDGRNWARIEGQEHHTGAVLDAGEPGDWDASFIGTPQVPLLHFPSFPPPNRVRFQLRRREVRPKSVSVLLRLATPSSISAHTPVLARNACPRFCAWKYKASLLYCDGLCQVNIVLQCHGRAQVLAVGPRDMRMYYHSFDAAAGRWTVGVATSEDGFKWAKRGPIFAGGADGAAFDACGASAHHVVRDVAARRCA